MHNRLSASRFHCFVAPVHSPAQVNKLKVHRLLKYSASSFYTQYEGSSEILGPVTQWNMLRLLRQPRLHLPWLLLVTPIEVKRDRTNSSVAHCAGDLHATRS